MEKVSAYKLSNGELILDRDKAIKRQSEINFDNQIDDLIAIQSLHSDEETTIRNFIDCNIPNLKQIFDSLTIG